MSKKGKTRADQKEDAFERLYAILGLTKINDGAQSPWLLLEHSKNAGLWLPVPEGEQLLATLRGGGAVEDLNKAEALLMDIHHGMDRKALAEKHYPDDPKADTKLKANLQALRRRQGWLMNRTMDLTVIGFQKVQELKGRQSIETDYLGGGEDESWRDSA